VGARPAPEIARTILSKPLAELTDDEFLADVAGGVNASLQDLMVNPELKSLMTPILRSDFQMLEGYSFVPREPLRVAITALGGYSDPTVSEADLQLWSNCTAAKFSLEMLDGDHFFVNQSERIVKVLNKSIAVVLSALANTI
jgi:medium-chain acyl-[acyl-carrier-protein] hydrolase